MSSQTGAQSLSLSPWIMSSSPEDVDSDVRSSCSSQIIDVSLEDSFSAQFTPLPMSCSSVESVCPSQSSRVLVSTPPPNVLHAGGKPQALIDRLQQLKQLQLHMQEQLKAHQLEQLQNGHARPSGMMQTTPVYNIIKPPILKNTEQPGPNSTHPKPKHSPAHYVLQPPEEVERAPGLSMRIQEPRVDQARSGHHSDHSDHEESLRSENKDMCQKDSKLEPHDRPIRSGCSERTFEEMLEEQLRLENEKLSKMTEVPPDAAKVKRTFLRRGQGLSRFIKGKTTGSFRDKATNSDNKPTPGIDSSAFLGPTNISRQTSEPKRTATKSISVTNVVTQRKTAVLNKNNVPQKTLAPVTKASAKAPDHEMNFRVEKQNERFGPDQHQITKNNKAEGEKILSHAMVDANKGAREWCNMDEQSAGIAESSFDVWLKERGEHWTRDQHREYVELGEFELLEKAADEFSFSSNSSFINTLLRRDGRRLSSTPVKFPPKSLFPHRYVDNSPDLNPVPSPPVPLVDSRAVIEEANPQPDEVTTESSVDGEVEVSDSSVCSNTIFDQPAITPNPQEPFSFQISEPPYDKRSYQDRDRAGGPAADVDSYRDSILVDTIGQVEFDDDDTWNDPENSISSPAKIDDQPDRVLKRKTALSKGAELDRCSSSPLHNEPGPQPTCQLVAKLFPALRPKPCPPPPKVPDLEEHSEQAKSVLLRERLVELETEIERFRKDNAALRRLRQENQEIQQNLRRERAEFEKNMTDELAKWEEFKREETRKLQREKKLVEKHAAAARARPDKQERDEIQSLKRQLNNLQEDLKKRETRWTSTLSRLRQQIDNLNTENATLRDQVRTLEKLRLSTWKNAKSEKETVRGRPGASSISSNIKATKSENPSKSIKSSPAENGMRIEVQNPASGTTSSTDQEKEPCPVAFSLHPSDHLVVSEIEKVSSDGERITIFPNGTRKQVSADGLSVTITFFNGDIKQMLPDQRVIYYYAEAQTTHTTYPDGLEVLQFPNNQIEKLFTDGHKEIVFPDQTVKNLYPDGREESVLLDGTIIQQHPDGTKQIQFSTGQRELHTAEFKRREYPDGTVKTVYSDGRQETRYPNGRVRLKNPEGCVIMDTQT
ncbi:Centromere protein J [Bagarius yarrelli]|uniref:Centromere protein J n=1 Tax=Bagarius yarrelli TaxID=175774 RepID=A0A556U4E6_BAGYA|nr:Centromere protein J [Bagarius yarrelli]